MQMPKFNNVLFFRRRIDETQAYKISSFDSETRLHSVDPYAQSVQPGELTLEESANGGLGRHLGIVSTTFLVYVRCRDFLLASCKSQADAVAS